ncbi:MAG: hypothetical protein HFE73_02755 [Firmicutes bacterium]|nr:hypothetical protein [Bacillota bacterium]
MRKRVIGLILIFASLATLGFWEFWGREHLTYEKILVLNQDVSRCSAVDETMFQIRMVEEAAEEVLRPEDMKDILQMETVQYIPAETPLYAAFFQDPALSVGEDTGRYILSIPGEWLMSYPQTLRRGDEVIFYCDGRFIATAPVAYARDSSNQEVVSSDDARLQASAAVSLVEVVVDEGRALKLGKLADEGKRFVLLYS